MMSGQGIKVTKMGFALSAMWRGDGARSGAGLRIGLSNSSFRFDETTFDDFPGFGEVIRSVEDRDVDEVSRDDVPTEDEIVDSIEDIGGQRVSEEIDISYMTLPIGFAWFYDGIEVLAVGDPHLGLKLNLFEIHGGVYGHFAWGSVMRNEKRAKFRGGGFGGDISFGMSASFSDYAIGIDASMNVEYLTGKKGPFVLTVAGGLMLYFQADI